MSVAGGLPFAIARAQIHQCETLQIFSKNASQWRARPLPPEEIAAFRAAATNTGISPIVAHASYLINLATTSEALRAQSIAALGEEVDRAEALGLLGVVLHPGARLTAPTEQALSLISSALTEVLKARPRGKTMILLEHTAGQGSTMGASFEEIAAMLDGVKTRTRLGVCLDTCHLLASGYDLCTEEGYRATFDDIRDAHRIRSAEGVSPERLEEAVHEPGRSARAHRQRLHRARAVPATIERPALRSPADDSGNGKDRMAGEGKSRHRSAGRDESEYAVAH